MKRWIAITLLAGLVGGCNQPTVKQGKQDAQLHWQETRARVAYGVADEQFKAGQLDGALAKVQEALALSPEDPDARLLLGKIYIEQGHYALAQTELKRVCDRAPRSYEAAFMLGVAQERAGHLDEALASYRKAQSLDSLNAQAPVAAAEVLVAMGKTEEAQAYVDAYLSTSGEEPGMFELAGRLAMMQEDYPLAARNYAQALDLDPASVSYREALGEALFLARRYAEAAETLRALTRLPKYKTPAWVHAMFGDCSMALNHVQEAYQSYLAAKDLDPASARNWTNLAKASLALDDPQRTILWAREALKREPLSPDVMPLLGYALLKDGQADKAVKVLAGAVEKSPEQIILRCLLGKAYAASGNVVQARECYQAALKMEPGNPLPKELLAAIDTHPSSPAAE